MAAHRSCRVKATDTYKATHIISGRTCGIHVATSMFVPRILNATANEPLAEMIRQLNVSPIYHNMLIALFNKYTLVGGMPEALVEYATNEDVSRLSPIYRSLLNGYNEDVEKYAKNANQVNVIRHLLTHGWTEAGQTITFNRFGGSNYTSKEVHEALEVLQNAFLLSLDYPITTVKAPAIPALTRQPKLIWLDSGIMNFSVDIQTEYLQNSSLLDVWKGHAAEQIVAQELRIVLDRNYRNEQYFWVRDKRELQPKLISYGSITPL